MKSKNEPIDLFFITIEKNIDGVVNEFINTKKDYRKAQKWIKELPHPINKKNELYRWVNYAYGRYILEAIEWGSYSKEENYLSIVVRLHSELRTAILGYLSLIHFTKEELPEGAALMDELTHQLIKKNCPGYTAEEMPLFSIPTTRGAIQECHIFYKSKINTIVIDDDKKSYNASRGFCTIDEINSRMEY